MYQLKVLLNRTSVPKEPKANMKNYEDFLTLVLNALVTIAAEAVLEDHPSIANAKELAHNIVDTIIIIQKSVNKEDDLYLYSVELFTLLLAWHNYHDSVKEGDGDRIMMLWKFLLIIFKKAQCKNYSKEAFILLMHCHFLLSDRLKEQLKWSRFVNTRGKIGCNIPCDLHMEHLNRQLKGALHTLRSNIQSGPIHRAGRSVGIVHSVALQFEKELYITSDSTNYDSPVFTKDLDEVLSVLRETDPFTYKHNRKFNNFKIKKPLLDEIDDNGKIADCWKRLQLIF